MNILIVAPGRPGPVTGTQVTSRRWALRLRGLGHRVALRPSYDGERCDLLVALHARRSYPSICRYRRERPQAPLLVGLTGSDLYADLRVSARARWSLEAASRLLLLQREGVRALPRRLRCKARVLPQSAPQRGPARRRDDAFEVCLLAHLRAAKDPFRAAMAARLLPAASRIRVLHLGSPLEDGMERRARREAERNPRYLWLGERPRSDALRILSRCRLLLLTSRIEGGTTPLTEALAACVPVLSTRIPGSLGVLGRNYPGYFPVSDTLALARLLERAEADPRFYARLERCCRRLAPRTTPEREQEAWRKLLSGLRREALRGNGGFSGP